MSSLLVLKDSYENRVLFGQSCCRKFWQIFWVGFKVLCVFMGAECQYSVGWTLKPKYFATYQSRNQVKFDIDG